MWAKKIVIPVLHGSAHISGYMVYDIEDYAANEGHRFLGFHKLEMSSTETPGGEPHKRVMAAARARHTYFPSSHDLVASP